MTDSPFSYVAQPTFYGLGVGPGAAGLLPVAALDILERADLIYTPRSKVSESSVALHALRGLPFDRAKVREVEFNMNGDDVRLGEHYAQLARELATHGRRGLSVAYLTIGDAMTYSTLGYLAAALRREYPQWPQRILPAPTSYATAAALTGFSLGEGKERVLILPCPDDVSTLAADIAANDVLVLMKVGERMGAVLAVLRELGISEHCALAHRIGLEGEVVLPSLTELTDPARLGYLSVLLIRKTSPRRFT